MAESLTARDPRARRGRSMVSLASGALAICLLFVVGLIALIAAQCVGYFWQKDLVRFEMKDGRVFLGQVHDREEAPPAEGAAPDADPRYRLRVFIANKATDELSNAFELLLEDEIAARTEPDDAIMLERRRGGPFIGYLKELREGDEVLAEGAEAWERFHQLHEDAGGLYGEAEDFREGPVEDLAFELTNLRWEIKRLELENDDPEGLSQARERFDRLTAEMEAKNGQLSEMEKRAETTVAVLRDAEGEETIVPLSEILRYLMPNQMGFGDKLGLYVTRWWEFVVDDPRSSNTEGGIFPAIFGTLTMVILMSLAVVPLGVLAALYLREYAKQGMVVRAVRIAVNNLAGTPSIVFGVFGLGFFVIILGGTIDELLYPERAPNAVFKTGGVLWGALTLALLTVPVVIVATEEGLAAVPQDARAGSLALGATKWETLRKVVLPASSPAILTGVILAMARAAGEVAPLMVCGLVKSANELPVDGHAPFVHFERKFMHLGMHIYDLALQSPDVEAVKPLVYATALLLVVLVTAVNLGAIVIRNKLRKKYSSSHV